MGADLVIGGALTVPAGGTLQLTAASITVQGRIEAPNGAVTLTSGGDAALNTEIDVSPGSLTVVAAGNIEAKSRLKARPGGSVTLDAGGTIATRSTAVIEVQDGGSADLGGDAGVTIGGKVFAYGSTVQLTSSAGIVTLGQDIRLDGGVPGSVTIAGAAGVLLTGSIKATRAEPGNLVIIQSSAGDVTLNGKVRVSGPNAGTIVVEAPNGTVGGKRGLDAKGKTTGGSVSVSADTIHLVADVVTRGSQGDGGSITLEATTLVHLDGADLDATGKVNGGSVTVQADVASGDVFADGSDIKASGSAGNAGVVQVSAPAGGVNLRAKITAGNGPGGKIFVDGQAVSIGPKALLDVDGGPGNEIRIAQTGAGLCALHGTFEARDGGTIEALAPAGSLTAVGRFRVEVPGCIGVAAGGVLDLSEADADIAVSAMCP
jgi:hypothetical protein